MIKPILFNAEMVRAILDGRKTTTRRVIKFPKYIQEQENGLYTLYAEGTCYENQCFEQIINYLKKPYQPGDILYVRETWQYLYDLDGNEQAIKGTGKYYYRASDIFPFNTYVDSMGITHENIPWRPFIHMPKEAARIFLKVTDVRVKRLQSMTLDDFLSEGVTIRPEAFNDPENAYLQAREVFIDIWNSTLKKSDLDRYGWNANPWVWAIEFKKCEKPEVELIEVEELGNQDRGGIGSTGRM